MLIYLASPYTDPAMAVRDMRCKLVQEASARLFRKKIHVISPIALCHPITRQWSLPGEFPFWAEFDRKLIAACDQTWVLTLEGWKRSLGVAEEISISRELGKPVRLIDPKTLELSEL